ncbi:hypothetical protein D3C87_1959360 [compost metagenome]
MRRQVLCLELAANSFVKYFMAMLVVSELAKIMNRPRIVECSVACHNGNVVALDELCEAMTLLFKV